MSLSIELINLQTEVFQRIKEMFANADEIDEDCLNSSDCFVGEMTEEHYEDAIDDIVDEEVDEDYKEELMEMVSYDDYINWLNK